MVATLLSAAAQADGYRLGAAYNADLLSNVFGGNETGSRYLDNFDLALEVDVA